MALNTVEKIKTFILRGLTSEDIPLVISLFYRNFISLFDGNNIYEKQANEIIERNTVDVDTTDLWFDSISSLNLSKDEYVNLFEEVVEKLDVDGTPKDVAKIAYEMMDHESAETWVGTHSWDEYYEREVILDIGSGYGRTMANFYRFAKREGRDICVAGIDINQEKALLSKMYMEIIEADYEVSVGDITKLDLIDKPCGHNTFVHPPFGMVGSSSNTPKGIDPSLSFKNNYDYLMIVSASIYELTSKQSIIALLPEGSMYRESSKEVREYLFKEELLSGIIYLPQKSLPNTYSPVSLLTISINPHAEVNLVDGRKDILKDGKKVELDVENIIAKWNSKSNIVDYQKIQINDFNLNPVIYFDKVNIVVDNPIELGEVCEIFGGYKETLDDGSFSSSPIAVRAVDVDDSFISCYGLKRMGYYDETFLQKYNIEENDILLTTKTTNIKHCMVRNKVNEKVFATGTIIVIRPNPKKINPYFLKMFLDSSDGVQSIRNIVQGSNVKIIPLTNLKKMNVPCPSLKKQNTIVSTYLMNLEMYETINKQAIELKNKLRNFYEENVKEDE